MKLAMVATLCAGLALGQSSYLGIGLVQLPDSGGIEVTHVNSGSPAEAAGLKVGDVIKQFNGQPVTSNEQLSALVRQTLPGRQVRLEIQREGATQTLTARIGTIANTSQAGGVPQPAPRMPDVRQSVPAWTSRILGVEAEELEGKQLAAFFGVTEGILVRSVVPGSAAEKAGIKAGDVITAVGSTKVGVPGEITARLQMMTGNSIAVSIRRNQQPVTVNVTFDGQ